MTVHSFRLAALLLLFGLGLTACGVNGSPDPPTPDHYPHQYPPPEVPPGTPTTVAPAPAAPSPAPGFPPNTTNTNQPMYQ
jgi:hypothetical protein